MAHTAALRSAGRTVGRYALFDEIASGGMATVHFGRLVGPVGFSRTVAIKCLHAQFAKDPEFIAMFLDEARLVSRIRHPNVVPTLDVVQEGGDLLLVMEYVQGETFSRLLRRCRTQNELPPIPIVATVLVGVLHGLHAAHEATGESGEALRIVHRDVSPQNILVGTDGVPRILDFGVAKATQRSQSTRDGQLKGKLAYMAPEQIASDFVDRRCDIFASGVVLWEALTGKRLFEGESDARIMQKVLAGDVPATGCSLPGLDAICMRSLARDPGARFQTARDMALAIERVTALAPASEAGAWVERLAHEVIAERAARVAEVESRSYIFSRQPPSRQPASQQTEREVDVDLTTLSSLHMPPRRPERSRVVVLLVAALVVLGIVGVGFVGLKVVAPRPPPRALDFGDRTANAAASPPLLPPEPTAAPTPAPAARTTARPPEVAATPTAATPPRVWVPKPPRSSPPAATKPHAADCSQPFAIDENGIQHVKAECL